MLKIATLMALPVSAVSSFFAQNAGGRKSIGKADGSHGRRGRIGHSHRDECRYQLSSHGDYRGRWRYQFTQLQPGNYRVKFEAPGFKPLETKGSVKDQARLDRRSHMLKIHQRLG